MHHEINPNLLRVYFIWVCSKSVGRLGEVRLLGEVELLQPQIVLNTPISFSLERTASVSIHRAKSRPALDLRYWVSDDFEYTQIVALALTILLMPCILLDTPPRGVGVISQGGETWMT
jgi:hypothetical protein